MFVPRALDAVRKLSAETVKVYLWVPVATLSMPMLFGEDFGERARAEAERTSVPYDSLCLEVRRCQFTDVYEY